MAARISPSYRPLHLAAFEEGEIGPELFRHACLLGLEGLVSKLTNRPYRPGGSPPGSR